MRRAPRTLHRAGALLCFALACSVTPTDRTEGDAGSAGASSGTGGSGAGASHSGTGGVSGTNSSAGRGGLGGASGATSGSGGTASGQSGNAGRAGETSSGGAGTSGATGGTNSAGDAGADTSGNGGTANGGSANGGTTSGTSGTSGASGTGGTSGTAGDTDRCDVANSGEEPPSGLTLTGNLRTHDPVVIAAHDRYYLFSTGDNIGAKTSSDLLAWQGAADVWTNATRPDWIGDEVPEAENLWAPDISYFGGQYHLYYAASTFGCNVSCIGHATRPALDTGTWTDHGSIICSNPGATCESNRPDDWNAIDPNIVVDLEGTPWLSFGSFWGGLKIIKLDETGARADDTLHSIAARPRNGGALEAPFIVRRCGYYYLFLSWDACCRGVDSTYNIRVGRSESVTGPYVDEAGVDLMNGGGTLLVAGDTRWRGPGHNAVIFVDDHAYNIYHSYDANNNGDSYLRIAELVWNDDGWPLSGGP